MNLLNYFEFIVENTDTLRLYYSKEFKYILREIISSNSSNTSEYDIANFLIHAEDSNQVLDKFTLIDITDKNDTISFIQSNRILRKYPDLYDAYINLSIRDEFFKSSSRTNINIGRWTRRVVKDVYKTTKYTDVMIEKFVNAYKSTFDSLNNSGSRFEVVSAEDIKKWYYYRNYKLEAGQLGNSCMRYEECQSYFDIYIENPEVCKLLILKDSEDPSKIVGRSLLWQLENGQKYQDRIYTMKDSDILLFEKWANQNDYLKYNDRFDDRVLSVKVESKMYNKYPYMDTFIVYNPETGILKADEELWPGQGYIKLQNTNGTFQGSNYVYSNYHDEYIDRDEAVECVDSYGDNDWVLRTDAMWLEYKDEWRVPSDDIIYSYFHKAYYLSDDLIYSELMGDTIYNEYEDIIDVIINKHGDVDACVKSRTDLYKEIDGKYYSKDYIRNPYTGKYGFENDIKFELYNKIDDEFKDIEDFNTILIEKYKNNDYENVDDDITTNIHYSSIFNVYWGLSKELKPTNKDIVCLLFANIKGKSESIYFPESIKKFDDEVYNRYIKWYSYDRRLTNNISKLLNSFDYEKFGDDTIYKMWLYFNL